MPLFPSTATPVSSPTSYRAAFNVTAVLGQAAVIGGSASATIYITKIAFITDTSLTLTIVKQSTATTGGTSAAVTRVPLNSNNAAATATVLQYTAAPTPGTSVGNIVIDSVTATDHPVYEFGTTGVQPITLHGTAQQIALAISAGAAVAGYIEWYEIPV